MGKSRSQRRREGGNPYFKLFPAETVLGWRVIRMVSGAQGEEMLARGRWREVYDEHGNHIGYQASASCYSGQEMLSGATSSSITARECELNAGVCGRSRTAGMTEEERSTRRDWRTGGALPPEDAIERAQAKVREWPLMHGDRAARVYPRGSMQPNA